MADDKKLDQIYEELRQQRELLLNLSNNVVSLTKDVSFLKKQLDNYEERLNRVEINIDQLSSDRLASQKINEERDKELQSRALKEEIFFKKWSIVMSVLMAIFTAINAAISIFHW
jgi:archaellum component FlaC